MDEIKNNNPKTQSEDTKTEAKKTTAKKPSVSATKKPAAKSSAAKSATAKTAATKTGTKATAKPTAKPAAKTTASKTGTRSAAKPAAKPAAKTAVRKSTAKPAAKTTINKTAENAVAQKADAVETNIDERVEIKAEEIKNGDALSINDVDQGDNAEISKNANDDVADQGESINENADEVGAESNTSDPIVEIVTSASVQSDAEIKSDAEKAIDDESTKTGFSQEADIRIAEEQAERSRDLSPTRLILKRFFRSRLSVIGLSILAFLFAFSFLGPFIYTRWGETETDTSQGRIIFIQKEVHYNVDGVEYIAFEIEYVQYTNNIYAPPSWDHFLGTDDTGMDVFTRLMYGGRISLTIGFVVVILETLIGVILGGLAGFFGKWVDQIIMRLVDIFNCIPTLPILLIASALLESWNVPGDVRIYYLLIMLTVFGWSGIARMVRGQILSLREQEYMVAAEAMGFSSARRIFKHLIPNVMPQLIVTMTLGLGGIILTEATLSYLGLGVPIPYAAWGTMIGAAKSTNILTNYFNMWGPPGLLIILAVLGFNFVGDGLRDALDPRMKR